MWGTARMAPVDSASVTSAAAVVASFVNGFSQTTEMPFFRKALAISKCVSFGVTTATTSTPSRRLDSIRAISR